MEEILNGIVLSAKDYKEKDKLVTLFTAEKGLVNVIFRGVRAPKAKLKMCKELFAFGKYKCFFNNSSDLAVAINCEIIDNFFPLSQNAEKYLEACTILSAVKPLTKYGQSDISLFFALMNALKVLCYDNIQENLTLVKLLLEIQKIAGYNINFDFCSSCYNDFTEEKFFKLTTGEVCCKNCKDEHSIFIDNIVYNNLRVLSKQEFEDLKSIKVNNIEECLKILSLNFELRFSKKLFNFSL